MEPFAWIVLIFGAVIFTGAVVLLGRKAAGREVRFGHAPNIPDEGFFTQPQESDSRLYTAPEKVPYVLNASLLTAAELNFYLNLRGVIRDRAVVCAKVRLGDIFRVSVRDNREVRSYRNMIDRKHIDFLLCDMRSMRPILGIELDDRSHKREDRQQRDAFVNAVFAAAQLPLIHVPVRRAFAASDIEMLLAPFLGGMKEPPPTPAPGQAPTLQGTAPVIGPPRCPKCGGEMILRTATNGAYAGRKFWSCSSYPNCRGILAAD